MVTGKPTRHARGSHLVVTYRQKALQAAQNLPGPAQNSRAPAQNSRGPAQNSRACAQNSRGSAVCSTWACVVSACECPASTWRCSIFLSVLRKILSTSAAFFLFFSCACPPQLLRAGWVLVSRSSKLHNVQLGHSCAFRLTLFSRRKKGAINPTHPDLLTGSGKAACC